MQMRCLHCPTIDSMLAHDFPRDDSAPCADATAFRFETHDVDSPGRAAVEALIAAAYRRRYSAQPPEFAPVLVSLSNVREGPVAAAGYQPDQTGRLFLERYLARPIEDWLPAHEQAPIPRSAIVEVGHLAAMRAGEGRRLMYPLACHLAERGYSWVVSTVTRELRQVFLRLGITPLAISAADPRALGDDRVHWGRYFEHQPVIVAGHLPLAIESLASARRPADANARMRLHVEEP